MLQVDADNVVLANAWLWRADHIQTGQLVRAWAKPLPGETDAGVFCMSRWVLSSLARMWWPRASKLSIPSRTRRWPANIEASAPRCNGAGRGARPSWVSLRCQWVAGWLVESYVRGLKCISPSGESECVCMVGGVSEGMFLKRAFLTVRVPSLRRLSGNEFLTATIHSLCHSSSVSTSSDDARKKRETCCEQRPRKQTPLHQTTFGLPCPRGSCLR